MAIFYSDIEQAIRRVNRDGTTNTNIRPGGETIRTTNHRGSLLSSTAMIVSDDLAVDTNRVALFPMSWGASIKEITLASGGTLTAAIVGIGAFDIGTDGTLIPLENADAAVASFTRLASTFNISSERFYGKLPPLNVSYPSKTLREIYSDLAAASTDDTFIQRVTNALANNEKCILGLAPNTRTTVANVSIGITIQYVEASPGSLTGKSF
jgi:hypothetical protein